MADDEQNGLNEEIPEYHQTNGDDEEDPEKFCDGQLSFIGQDVDCLPQKLIDDYSKVTRRLDLSFNRIRSLDGLEEFINLEELILDNNELSNDTVFPALSHLNTLTLNKNQICDLEPFLEVVRSAYPKLTYLSLLGNTACPNQLSAHDKDEEDYIRYRHLVLYRLPNLKFLDSSPIKQSDREEANRVGPFLMVVRGSGENTGTQDEVPFVVSPYTPLPENKREVGEHIGSFGKSKYVYYGKHSEGNRFIRNNDL